MMVEGGCKAVFTAWCNVEMQYANNYHNFYDMFTAGKDTIII